MRFPSGIDQWQRTRITQPATWLSVIGRDGYWPLATLNEPLENTKRFSNLALVEKSHRQAAAKAEDRLRPQTLSLSSSWRFFCVLALADLRDALLRLPLWIGRPDLGMFVQFTRLAGWRGPALIAAGWAVICSLLIILFLTSARIFFKWLDSPDKVWVVIMGIATAAAFVLAMLRTAMVERSICQRKAGRATTAQDRQKQQLRRSTGCIDAQSMFVAIVAVRCRRLADL